MLRFQRGDEAAFTELVENNLPRVRALVLRFLRDDSQADDITQEAFLRIVRNIDSYQPSARFSTYLYRIVANLCFNAVRDGRKFKPFSIDGISENRETFDLPDHGAKAPDHDIHRQELRALIADAIGKLPENQRLAILLNKFHDKPYAEIAEIMDTTPSAVKSLLARARSGLAETLSHTLKAAGHKQR